MAIRFEKKTDAEAKNDKAKKDAKVRDDKIDTDTYASLQKPEKKPKKGRF